MGGIQGFPARASRMAVMIRDHIEENQISDDDLLFPQWMFAFRRPSTGLTVLEGQEVPPPITSATGEVYEHGTMGARFTMNCHCDHCKAYAAWYARERRARAREASPQQRGRADVWRRDGSEFLSDDVWSRIWRAACDTAGLRPRLISTLSVSHLA